MADPGDAATPYQSLYRRFRPQRFDEVRGQDHVCLALRNAVAEGRVGHAYLMSGPRGTGKTSTARILAKALNCAAPVDGEPCGECTSCIEIARGTSLDVHELDAASNNGVDAMRDLVARAALGTPGRWKVYIIDEVHMLTAGASNALLKTLEEPPAHVVFVLATTDPLKVLPTIRSRTQHFEFRLLGPDELSGLLRDVREAAGLELADEAVDVAVRRGRGSARDALSTLDQLSAGGQVDDEAALVMELVAALAARDTAGALGAVARAAAAGREPQRLAADLCDVVRQAFLSLVAPELVTLVEAERAPLSATARELGLPRVVRSLEVLGDALMGMRESPDPRIHLEVALVRLTHAAADDSPAALLERIERLEHALAAGVPAGAGGVGSSATSVEPRSSSEPASSAEAPPPGAAPTEPAPGAADPDAARGRSVGAGPALARETLGAVRRRSQGSGTGGTGTSGEAGGGAGTTRSAKAERPTAAARARRAPAPSDTAASEGAPEQAAPASPPVAGPGDGPTRDDLVKAWGDGLLGGLPGRARARFRVGRFVAVEGGCAVYALPNETHRAYCEDVRTDVERSLSSHFGVPVSLRLVVDEDADDDAPDGDPAAAGSGLARSGAGAAGGRAGSAAGNPGPPEPDLLDPAVLEAETDLAGAGLSPEERLKQAFPGAQEL